MELKWQMEKIIYVTKQIYEQIISLIVNTFQYVIRCIFDVCRMQDFSYLSDCIEAYVLFFLNKIKLTNKNEYNEIDLKTI